MCGIVGWITTSSISSVDRRRFIEAALIVDTIRGQDSAGAFFVPHVPNKTLAGAADWCKELGDGYSFVNSKEFRERLRTGTGDYRAIIGHNRSATRGGVTMEAAHPFQEGPITLVHNGTLQTTTTLEKSQFETNAENDSHTIAHNLALFPAADVIKRIDGSFAMIWHDARDDSIYAVRNNERPLHFARDSVTNTIYIASTSEILMTLLRHLKITAGPIVEPKAGILLKFTAKLPQEPEVIKCELYTKPTAGFTGGTKTTTAGGKSSATKNRSIVSTPPNDSPLVMLGGRRREVPKPMKKRMKKHSFSPSLLLAFVPKMALPAEWPTAKGIQRRATVHGYISSVLPYANMMPCVINGAPQTVWENHRDVLWTIRPIGIRYLEEEANFCVIGKLIKFTSGPGGLVTRVADHEARQVQAEAQQKLKEELRRVEEASKPSVGSIPEIIQPAKQKKKYQTRVYDTGTGKWTVEGETPPWDETTPTKSLTGLVKGKYGAWVSPETFRKDTQDGCCMCGCNLSILDHLLIEWTDQDVGGQVPWCPGCARQRDVVLNDSIREDVGACGYGCTGRCLATSPDDCLLRNNPHRESVH